MQIHSESVNAAKLIRVRRTLLSALPKNHMNAKTELNAFLDLSESRLDGERIAFYSDDHETIDGAQRRLAVALQAHKTPFPSRDLVKMLTCKRVFCVGSGVKERNPGVVALDEKMRELDGDLYPGFMDLVLRSFYDNERSSSSLIQDVNGRIRKVELLDPIVKSWSKRVNSFVQQSYLDDGWGCAYLELQEGNTTSQSAVVDLELIDLNLDFGEVLTNHIVNFLERLKINFAELKTICPSIPHAVVAADVVKRLMNLGAKGEQFFLRDYSVGWQPILSFLEASQSSPALFFFLSTNNKLTLTVVGSDAVS